MIDLKKINQIREGISLRDRPASRYGNLLGPKYGMDDKDDGNTPPTVPKTERDKKFKAALEASGNSVLTHSMGKSKESETVLTSFIISEKLVLAK